MLFGTQGVCTVPFISLLEYQKQKENISVRSKLS